MTDWSAIPAGIDAVFLPGKIHGCDWQLYVLYMNEAANDENGSWEIEILDAQGILWAFEEAHGDVEGFFAALSDLYQGRWCYCDNGTEGFDEYMEAFDSADFIVGRDGNTKDEMNFLVEWAKRQKG